jgi:hypothetical protein
MRLGFNHLRQAMWLTAQQTKKLHGAILSGFSASDLEQLTWFKLNKRLNEIVSAGPISGVVWHLIHWAEMYGRLEDLVQAIRQARPNHREIEEVANDLLAPPASELGLRARDAGPLRARLRAALLDEFPTQTGLAMLVNDSLGVKLSTVAGGTNLAETMFELIQWAGIDPEQRLRPLLAEAVRQRPSAAELKALQTELFGS